MTDPTQPPASAPSSASGTAATPSTWQTQQPHTAPTYAGQPYAGYPPPQQPRPASGMAIAALILGIVGSLFGLVPLTFWIAGPLGVTGLVLGLVALGRARRAQAPKKMAIAGTAVSVLALVLSVVGAVIFFTAVDQLGEDLENIGAPIGTAAVSPSSEPDDEPAPTSEAPADSGPATGSFGQPVELTVDNEPAGTYTLNKPVISARGGEFDPRPKHGAYVSVKMTVKALPGKKLEFNTFLEFYVRGADGARYDSMAIPVREPELISGAASEGRPATGWVTFDAPTHGTIVFHNALQDDPIVEWTY